jgi:hypothetical protein
MNARIPIVTVLFVSLALTACQPTVLTPSPGDVQTAIALTEAALPEPSDTPAAPSATSEPTNTPTVTPEPTNTPRGPIAGTVNAAFLNMREGPSTLFNIVNTYIQGDDLEAVARSADGDWLQVHMSDDDQVGWMATLFVDLAEDPEGLAVIVPPDSESMHGRVEDTDGNPIAFITIAVINREGSDELRADVRTTEDGNWTLLIPANSFTLMDVQIVGYGCDSIIMDDDCNLIGYYELQGREFVNLPQENDVVFQFAAVQRTISGTVLDADGDPIADMLVVGERDDGAETLTFTDADGSFVLGADSGTWEVYAVVIGNTRNEGERVVVDVGEDDVTGIELLEP